MDMPKGNSHGPDDFTMNLFHICSPIIKHDIWELVEDSHGFSNVLPVFDTIFLALVHKEEKAEDPKYFQPIALFNVVYKIITKVMFSRLEPILPRLISLNQIGCMEGRQILNGIILAH